MRLPESLRIALVFSIRPLENNLPILPNALLLENGQSLVVLAEGKAVTPLARLPFRPIAEAHIKYHVWVAASRQTANSRDSPPVLDRASESPAYRRYVV
jgi:hypothetical protein